MLQNLCVLLAWDKQILSLTKQQLYRSVPKYLDSQVWENSADLEQTEGAV